MQPGATKTRSPARPKSVGPGASVSVMAGGSSIHLWLAFITTNISLDWTPPSFCSVPFRNSYRPFMPSVVTTSAMMS